MIELRPARGLSRSLTSDTTLGAVAAFILAGSLLFAGLGSLPLLNPDEGRNAEVAREMSLNDDWLIPTYLSLPYLDKPAFHFALIALAYRLGGVSETTARLPSALSALGLLFLVHWFVRREYGKRTAALAVVTVVTMPLFLVFGRAVIFDMPLALLVSAAVLTGYHAGRLGGSARHRHYYACAALGGLATLLKGPVGFVLPLLTLVAFALVERRSGDLRGVLFPFHSVPFWAIVLPWFVAVSLRCPDFPYYGLVRETAARLTTPEFQRSGPIYYYLPVLLGFCFGWSVLLPGALVLAWKRRRCLARSDRLLVVWGLVVIAFFSLSQSKLPGYILSAAVALGILVARLFDRAFANPGGEAARAIWQGTTTLIVLCLLLAGWLGVEAVRPGWWSHILDISGRDYERARPLFGPALISLVLVGLGAMLSVARKSVRIAFVSFALVPVSLLGLGARPLLDYAEQNSSRQLAGEVRTAADGAPIAILSSHSPGLTYYLGEPTLLITDDGSETTSNYIPYSLARSETWPPGVIRRADLAEWLEERDGRLFLLAGGRHGAQLKRIAERYGLAGQGLTGNWVGLLLPARVER